MKKYIECALSIEGIHRWESCNIEEVKYLRDYHRHLFEISVIKEVTHSNRDIEFIQFKHKIFSYLKEQYWSIAHNCCFFGNSSCEMIAEELIRKFGLSRCSVKEDGENGALLEVESNEDISHTLSISTGKKIIVVSGRICTGKSHFIQKFFEKEEVVGVGDIVREITDTCTRTIDETLDKKIISNLLSKIKDHFDNSIDIIVIDGIRQKSIFDAINSFCIDNDVKLKCYWLQAPYSIRRERYDKRNDQKDNCVTFGMVDSKESPLIEEFEEFAFNSAEFIKINN